MGLVGERSFSGGHGHGRADCFGYAAFNGHAENVGWLLERCGTDASDSIDKALLFSSIHGHDKVVQLLLDAGAVSQETRHAARKLAGDHNHNHVVVLFTPDGQRDLSMNTAVKELSILTDG